MSHRRDARCVPTKVHTKENTPRALEESAVSALLDALRVGEGTDLVRELAQWALQQLIDAEATERIGADPWERTAERTTQSTGFSREKGCGYRQENGG